MAKKKKERKEMAAVHKFSFSLIYLGIEKNTLIDHYLQRGANNLSRSSMMFRLEYEKTDCMALYVPIYFPLYVLTD